MRALILSVFLAASPAQAYIAAPVFTPIGPIKCQMTGGLRLCLQMLRDQNNLDERCVYLGIPSASGWRHIVAYNHPMKDYCPTKPGRHPSSTPVIPPNFVAVGPPQPSIAGRDGPLQVLRNASDRKGCLFYAMSENGTVRSLEPVIQLRRQVCSP